MIMDNENNIIDMNRKLGDIKDYMPSCYEKKTNAQKVSSNPILKKFLLIHNKKSEQKFSLKDLFR